MVYIRVFYILYIDKPPKNAVVWRFVCVLAHTTSYHRTSDTIKDIAMLWRACIVLNLIRSVASECVAQKRDLEDLKRPHNTTISENP